MDGFRLHLELKVVDIPGSFLPSIVATPVDAEDGTEPGDGITPTPPLDQRIASDTSSANSVAAFFKMAFSISKRFTCASNV